VLKTILGVTEGNASTLIHQLGSTPLLDGVPEEVKRGFGDTVLMSLPFLRNRLGGHGQGKILVEVPRTWAQLALHLAGSFNLFLIQTHLACSPTEEGDAEDEALEYTDSDVPF